MLTDQAHSQRKWGLYPTLRQALQDKHIPDHYYGPTSVSDNMFEQMRRLMEISILTEENEAAVCDVARSNDNRRALWDDLHRLEDMLEGAAKYFTDRAQRIRNLRSKVSSL